MNAPRHHLLAALYHQTPIAYADTKKNLKKCEEKTKGGMHVGVYVVGVVGWL